MSYGARARIASEADDLANVLLECYSSPELFARAILNVDYLYPWQQDASARIEEQVRAGVRNIRVLVRACHGAGKDFFSAVVTLWWMYTRHASGERPRGLTLAPTWPAIEKLLWAEIGAIWQASKLPAFGWGKLLDTELHLEKGVFALGLSSDKPAKLEGQHSRGAALRIIDEAKEIEKGWFEATKGLLNAPTSLDLWISTPSIEEGEFYRRDLSRETDVVRLKVTVDDLIRDFEAEGFPTLAGMKTWRGEARREWGEGSPAYRSRALAEYIRDSSGKLFPTAFVDAALHDVKLPMDGATFVAGQDVAGSVDGDENAVAVLRVLEPVNPAAGKDSPDGHPRYALEALEAWHEHDTSVSRERGHAIASRFKGAPQRIDSIGMGKGVLDEARSRGYNAEEYRASDKPYDEVQFANKKAEDAWRFRLSLEKGCVDLSGCPEDQRQKLRSQFSAMKWKTNPRGRIQVVDPPDSPDLVDAILIASSVARQAVGASVDVDWLD